MREVMHGFIQYFGVGPGRYIRLYEEGWISWAPDQGTELWLFPWDTAEQLP